MSRQCSTVHLVERHQTARLSPEWHSALLFRMSRRRRGGDSVSSTIFEDLVFCFSNSVTKATDIKELRSAINERGGLVPQSLTKKTTHYVASSDDLQKPNATTKKATERSAIFTVNLDFIRQCVEKDSKLLESDYPVDEVKQEKDKSAPKQTTAASKRGRADIEESVDEPTSTKRKKGGKAKSENKERVHVSDEDEPTKGQSNVPDDDPEDDPKGKKRSRSNKSDDVRTTTKRPRTKETKDIKDNHIDNDEDINDNHVDNDEEDDEEARPKRSRAKRAAVYQSKAAISKQTKGGAGTSNDDDVPVQNKVADPPVEAPKIVTQIKKGTAAVDQNFSDPKNYHVLERDGEVFDCLLNQTDIKKNHNKYYIIQVLKKDNASKFICFTKWGRVGAKAGQKEEPFSDMDSAILSFQSKFREKTTNDWDDRHNFVHKKGKYFLLERGDEEELPKLKPESHEPPPPTPESKLPEQVQDLMKLIFDIDSMTKEMMSIGYDATKAPLGQLSKKTIQQGYEKLKKISEAIQTNANMDTLMDLSSEFYTVIPHVYKNNQRPEVIRNFEMVKIKLTMVEALADIEIATKLLDETKAIHDANPIDTRYNSLQCGLQPIDHSTDEFKMVVDYTRNTHASTHNYYGLEVLDIFEVDREGELERYSTGKGGEIKSNRQLLWHGSRMSNFAGILSQGLRIAPPSAPVSGYMFGKGVYFANMVSKSANYCFTSPENNVGLLLLCEVALGEPNELLHSDYNADRAMEKAGKHCTKGCGSTAPDPKGSIVLKDGTLVPMGKGISSGVQGSLLYDELIVYDITQIKIRYLVKMKFDYKNKRY